MPYNVQNVVTQAMVTVMAVSVASVAMGIVIGAMGPEVLKLPPAERKGTKKALDDLRTAFGSEVVNAAIKNVGADDVLALCKEVERLYVDQLKEKFGSYAVDVALKSAPPGDLKAVSEIALALARRGYGKFVPPKETPAPPRVEEKAVIEGVTRGRRLAKPQKDTKTGIIYRSKAAAGMAVAAEYGLDPSETFIWYEVVKRDPKRFVPVSLEEYEKYVRRAK